MVLRSIVFVLVLTLASGLAIAEKKNPTEGKVKVFVFTSQRDKDGFTDGNKKAAFGFR